MSGHSIKVLTYNIHKGFSATNQRFVLHEIKQAVITTRADFVFLQEVYGEQQNLKKKHGNWPENSQFEFIADSIWSFHAYARNAVYDAGHHGNAILSKYPIVDWENINVSMFKNASRSLLHCVIKVPGCALPLHLICVHLGLFGFERRKQLQILIQRIKSHVPDHEPLVVAGDFNDWMLRARHFMQNELGISEVFKAEHGRYARSFPAWMPLLKMDRIYSRGLKLRSAQPLTGSNWRKLSDHTPLLAEFELAVEDG
jgi:endonuclease/exonuclease/phosphatase family metal-dependent hydrolase